MILLTGCARTAISSCPPLVDYTAVQTQQLIRDLEGAGPQQVWPYYIIDYATLRKNVRACHKNNR